MTGKDVLKPSSFCSLRSQIVSQVHLARALYSDSHEDLEVEFYFFEDQEIGMDPLVNKYALVDVLSSRFLA